MKKLILSLSLLCLSLVFTGCIQTPVPAAISITEYSVTDSINNEFTSKKTGTATCKQYVLLFANGDCTVSKAMENGNITKVHSVEHSVEQYLIFYGTYTTIVKGE